MRANPEKLFIGMSATPWAKGMGETWDDLVIPATLGDGFRDGWLSPYVEFVAAPPDLSKGDTDGEMPAEMVAELKRLGLL